MTRSTKRWVCAVLVAAGLVVLTVQGPQRRALAQDKSGGEKKSSLDTKDISMDQAHAAIEAAVKRAAGMKIKMNGAGGGGGGESKALSGMGGGSLGGIGLA